MPSMNVTLMFTSFISEVIGVDKVNLLLLIDVKLKGLGKPLIHKRSDSFASRFKMYRS